jgi:hypothetical protein
MAAARAQKIQRLPPEVNRALYVRNLPFKITAEEMYDIFGKFGAIRQIRLGNAQDTRGTAFVVYEDIYDAKTAVDHLSGFNVCGRCACRRRRLLSRRRQICLPPDPRGGGSAAVGLPPPPSHTLALRLTPPARSRPPVHADLVVLYYQQTKMQKRLDTEREMKELAEMRAKLGIDSGDAGADLSGR